MTPRSARCSVGIALCRPRQADFEEDEDEPLELDPPSEDDDAELEDSLELDDESDDDELLDPLPPLPDDAVLVADGPDRLSVL
jgi:hypothetical protein